MQHSLYLHIPFCTHRCAYCDFNTYAGQGELIPAYVAGLCREIEHVGKGAPSDLTLHTIYFGGGTPSLLSPTQIESILGSIEASYRVEAEAEITVEANPGTISAECLRDLRAMGVNRISLGVQSANGEELRLLERTHSFLEVIQAVTAARRAGFGNLSVDLIYGLPEQDLATWQSSVRRILALEPDHISAYALTLEHGTPFERWTKRGLMAVPDPDGAADMYEWISGELPAAAYEQYEISNWARESKACRHNLQYWRGMPYLGFGAGAHGYAGGFRYSNVLSIRAYIDRMRDEVMRGVTSAEESGPISFPLSPAAVEHHRQVSADDISEFMIMGLRLTGEGIAAESFQRRFGFALEDRYGQEIQSLNRLGLLELIYSDGRPRKVTNLPEIEALAGIRLTRRGRLLGNRVFSRFV